MSAGPPPNGGSLLSATDFFGKTDGGGIEKFKTVAFRALHEQKLEEELHQTMEENEQLKEANTRVTRNLEELQTSFDANIEDRERVLAFKSKRIEELNNKLRECEAINASLLQTINGGEVDTAIARTNSTTALSTAAEPTGTQTEARTRMMTLINAGKPLFHALDTCKELEYKQLYEDSQRKCAELVQTALENEAAIRETRQVQFNKQDSDAKIKQLQDQLAAMTLEKDELGHHLERKLILENDRLRREKESELQAFHDTMRTQMRMQLDVTTQRTVEENERVQLELRYQSSQLEKMMKQIDELRAENKRTKQEANVFEEMNTGLSKKLKFYEQLFAKMQQKDEQRPKQLDNQLPRTPKSPFGPPSTRRTPRKPPLPALSTLTPESPSLYGLGSPHGSYFSPDDSVRYPEIDLNSMDAPSSYHLNAVTDVLEKHLQSREFTKKQVVAVLRYHQEQYHRRERVRVFFFLLYWFVSLTLLS
ncbi:Cilia- and flagella-associated protein 157 [Phytophthora citrophthora]|uniref:Cilia- and flagella-associated protein 157 n=1 Tax=Phytophthora citrophthora TaxID=4793 RepID=A0AAD9GYT7_9STRA|nr:Cilia- and flagella-associated protein 157 [Phytophthora citrophthora]